MEKTLVTLSIVCPMFNEETSVMSFFDLIHSQLSSLSESYELICINDGSTDNTLEYLKLAMQQYRNTRVINLSRNFGKEAALTAGLDLARGEAVIPIDADLQDAIEIIPKLIEKWREGYDMVLAKRIDRHSDTTLKRICANLFYKCHNSISNVKIPENVGDFRLVSRKVVEVIKQLDENQRFMKGLFAWVGYRTAVVEYARKARMHGRSKFSAWRLWNLALEGFTGFSTAPLRIWLYIGIFISSISFFYGGVIVAKTLLFGIKVPGYASLITSILFLGGVQLMSVGILGEYIGRMHIEVKRRPSYIVESELQLPLAKSGTGDLDDQQTYQI